jgi:copper transport protein
MMRRIPLLLTLLVLCLSAAPASAHGFIVRAIPENRAALERSPVRVQYWFSESLEPAFSSITVRDEAGAEIASGGVSPDTPSLMSARLPPNLPDGAYSVDLRIAFASDGHVIAERRSFFVGEADASAGTDALPSAVALEVVWRALLLVGTTLLFGVYGAYALVFVPAWGNAAHPAGRLPPRVMTRVHQLAGVGLALAFVGNVVALLQQSMAFFDADIGRVLSEGLWNVVRTATRFGDTWNARMLVLALVAGLHAVALYVRRDNPALVRPFLTANAWAMPILVGTWSVSAHAAGSPVLPWVALASDWLHGSAVGLWAGGVAALALTLPVALRPLADADRGRAMLSALRRFSLVAAACLLVVLATGVYSASNWITQPSDAGTPYGLALALKIALIAPLLWLAWMQRRAVQRQHTTNRLPLEALIALLVLGAAALLSATPVPPPEIAGRDIPPPSASIEVSGITVSATTAPGGPGVNTYDILLTQDGQPVDSAAVQVRWLDPARDLRQNWQTAEPLGDGLYSSAGFDLDRAGMWWLLVDVTMDADTAPTRAAFIVDVRADAAVALTRDPSLINLIALAVVMAALSFAGWRALRPYAARLDWSPTTVAVAAGAVIATIGIGVVGVVASNNAAADYTARLNPLPQIVNPALPDADSLARGDAALAACGWSGGDVNELRQRLPRTRDEDLYALLRDGWRSLPACGDEPARWDMVNYLRTLEQK